VQDPQSHKSATKSEQKRITNKSKENKRKKKAQKKKIPSFLQKKITLLGTVL
jgi:hypothetical protein